MAERATYQDLLLTYRMTHHVCLTADEIAMDPNAVLGPIDPQIGELPAASIVKLLEIKRAAQIDDEMLVLADVAQKARVQVAMFVAEVLLKHLPKDRAAALPTTLSEAAGLTISRSRWKPHASWDCPYPRRCRR